MNTQQPSQQELIMGIASQLSNDPNKPDEKAVKAIAAISTVSTIEKHFFKVIHLLLNFTVNPFAYYCSNFNIYCKNLQLYL